MNRSMAQLKIRSRVRCDFLEASGTEFNTFKTMAGCGLRVKKFFNMFNYADAAKSARLTHAPARWVRIASRVATARVGRCRLSPRHGVALLDLHGQPVDDATSPPDRRHVA